MSEGRRPVPADVYLRVFSGPAGEEVLDELTALFCRPAVTVGGIDAILQTYCRVGCRMVVDHVVSRINAAHEERRDGGAEREDE